MFDGRDYNSAFEEARDKLADCTLDRDEVLGHLVGIEWTLWEAIRGAMIMTGNIAALFAIAPIAFFAWQSGQQGWIAGSVCIALWLTVSIGLYWIFKFVAFFEITRHVKGRKFGTIDLPWLPGSTNYDPGKYPLAEKDFSVVGKYDAKRNLSR